MSYELKRQTNGSMAVYNRELGETMHPGGPWYEANLVYVEGTGLAGALVNPRLQRQGEVCVFDVGLGAAANAIAAIECHRERSSMGRPCRGLRLVSFERDLGALEMVLADPEGLPYLAGYEESVRELMDEGQCEPAPGVVWELRMGDFTRLLAEEPERADIVFFDPFSHRSNPEMWSLPTLRKLYACRRKGKDMILATYSSAYGVRAAFLLAGFFVGEGPRKMPGRRTTIAATQASLLSEPLDGPWLSRWRRDREPWPPLTPADQYRDLRETLLEHPQWEALGEEMLEEPAPPPRGWAKGVDWSGRPLLERAPLPAVPPANESRRARARRRDAERGLPERAYLDRGPAEEEGNGRQGGRGARNGPGGSAGQRGRDGRATAFSPSAKPESAAKPRRAGPKEGGPPPGRGKRGRGSRPDIAGPKGGRTGLRNKAPKKKYY